MACEGRGMKGSKKLPKPIFLASIDDAALANLTALAEDTSCGYVAHEWGTFTWVQSALASCWSGRRSRVHTCWTSPKHLGPGTIEHGKIFR